LVNATLAADTPFLETVTGAYTSATIAAPQANDIGNDTVFYVMDWQALGIPEYTGEAVDGGLLEWGNWGTACRAGGQVTGAGGGGGIWMAEALGAMP
jgi:hypothetical protein